MRKILLCFGPKLIWRIKVMWTVWTSEIANHKQKQEDHRCVCLLHTHSRERWISVSTGKESLVGKNIVNEFYGNMMESQVILIVFPILSEFSVVTLCFANKDKRCCFNFSSVAPLFSPNSSLCLSRRSECFPPKNINLSPFFHSR